MKLAAISLLALGAGATAQGSAGPQPALPPDTVVVLEWCDGGALVERAEQLVQDLERMPLPLQLGLGLVEAQVLAATGGLGLVETAAALSPGPALVGLQMVEGTGMPFLVAAAGAEDEGEDAAAGRQHLLGLLPAPWTVLEEDDRIVVASTRERAEAIRAHSVATGLGEWQRPPGEVGIRVSLDAIRAQGDSPPLWPQLDGGGRYLVGPLARAVDEAGELRGDLLLGDHRIELRAELDGTALAVPAIQHLFAAGSGERPLPPEPEGAFATLALDRDLHGFWSHLGELLNESEAVQAEAFLSIADLLTRASFVDEFLPALGAEQTLFAVELSPDARERGPDASPIRLPSFVLVSSVRDESAERMALQIFRALFFVTREERQRLGKPLFRVRREVKDGHSYWVAEPEDRFGPDPQPLDLQFTPTLAFTTDHAVLSSTLDGARRAVRSLRKGGGQALHGDGLRFDPPAVARALARNRPVLVLNEVLDSGKTLAEARQGQDLLLALLRSLESGELSWRPEPERTVVELAVVLR